MHQHCMQRYCKPASPLAQARVSVKLIHQTCRRTNTESRFSRVMKLLVRGSGVLLTCCSSHTMGASAALKIFFTASAISGPMPSPGKRVAVMGPWLLNSLRIDEQTSDDSGYTYLAALRE